MYYDRTVSKALVDELESGGAFSYVVDRAKKQHLCDLQLRGYPGKKPCWATLYVGLTKVLDVHEKNGTFRLKGKDKSPKWDKSWETFASPEIWRSRAAAIENYLTPAIGEVPERFTNEGAVQSMLCTRASALFSVVDREAVVGFVNEAERKATYTRLQDPLHAACAPDPELKWFVPKKFGGELDLLAIDPSGRLLVIEIKPGSSTSGITWAPLQATFYAELFRAWSGEVRESARGSLESMLKQRVDLGLTNDPLRGLQYPLEIVPVVAIGGEPSEAAITRLWKVQDSLLKSGAGSSNLEVWHVEESVARNRLSPSVAQP